MVMCQCRKNKKWCKQVEYEWSENVMVKWRRLKSCGYEWFNVTEVKIFEVKILLRRKCFYYP